MKKEVSELRNDLSNSKEKLTQLTFQAEKNEKLKDSYKNQLNTLKIENTTLLNKSKQVQNCLNY